MSNIQFFVGPYRLLAASADLGETWQPAARHCCARIAHEPHQVLVLLFCRKQEYIDLADVRWMREKWRELMARTHGDFSPPPYTYGSRPFF